MATNPTQGWPSHTATNAGAYPRAQNNNHLRNSRPQYRHSRPRSGNARNPGLSGRQHQGQLIGDWSTYRSILMALRMVPPEVSTWDIWKSLSPFGNIVYVEIDEDRHGERTGLARVRFEPPPRINFWANSWCHLEVGGTKVVVVVEALTPTANEGAIRSPLRNAVPAKVVIKPSKLSFGVLVQPTTVMQMKSLGSLGAEGDFSLTVDFSRRKVVIHFPFRFQDPLNPELVAFDCQYRLDIRFKNITKFYRMDAKDGQRAVMISLDCPPQFWRKKGDFERTHSAGRLTWGEQDVWARTVEISPNPDISRAVAASLDNDHQLIDLGRWTTYCLEMDEKAAGDWSAAESAICDWNIKTRLDNSIQLIPRSDSKLWSMLEGPRSQGPSGTASELLTHSLLFSLPFDVRYQLEVCISQDILQEHNISAEFLSKLAQLANSSPQDRDRARLILEYAADRGKKIFSPLSLFEDKAALTFCPTTVNIPHYCALVRKVTVTPTRIYFNSPTVETTNRVIRHFEQQQDNFLRVQFTDELNDGRINGSDAARDNQIYTRVFRVLNNGIRMGRWHWQFLAFGSSQIRESGAFFFCQPEGKPEDVVTCDKIRQWMGKFNHIKVVAKYAARLGQCFSTTRLLRGIPAPKVVRIPDIESHGYCFTDGVGKISPFLAQMIARDWDLDTALSAYQFRLGGCKGVLVVWEDATGLEVHIRKSQEKFHAEFNGLEIIRCSHFSVATLNRQTITILSSLGVPDEAFVNLLAEQLRSYDQAMKNHTTAVQLLSQYVDENQMTLTLARMVLDGFMEASEPFTMALLQLWRSWSIKALKEKARIIVEKSAFVLGCVDETGTLRGYDKTTGRRHSQKAKYLPQIFIQVPDPQDRGTYKVITGLCAVGRNPSLHPGDIRVVEAVDVPALRHIRDVVVFPLHGSRDIPSMCSGGDLDGDDFFVIWDQNLLPQEWFNGPMNYTGPPPKELNRDPTVQDLKTFFALYMKNNSLPLIAHAHLAQADFMDSGPKDPRCIRLAELHSQAVDYVKTGVEAEMDKKLAPRRWPHFMEKAGKATYHSSRVLGQLYDMVHRVDFRPRYEMPFDSRILTRYKLPNELLKKARRIKSQYDAALRRIMGQMEIKTEFEIWTAFVLSKPRVGTQYKLHETVRRESEALKQQHRDICIKEAGGSRDIEALGPFAAAMYQVTWEEVQIALHESRTDHIRKDGTIGRRPIRPYSMPLISFPWLFDTQLGQIATGSRSTTRRGLYELGLGAPLKSKTATATTLPREVDSQSVMDLDYARTSDGQVIHRGEILRLFQHDDEDDDYNGETSHSSPTSASPQSTDDISAEPEEVPQTSQTEENPCLANLDNYMPASISLQPTTGTCVSHATDLPPSVSNANGELKPSLTDAGSAFGAHGEGAKENGLGSNHRKTEARQAGAAAPSSDGAGSPTLLDVGESVASFKIKIKINLVQQNLERTDLIDLSEPSSTNFTTTDDEQGYTPTDSIGDESPKGQFGSGEYTTSTGQSDPSMDNNSEGESIVGLKVNASTSPDPFLDKEGTTTLSGDRFQYLFTENIHTVAGNSGTPFHELSLPYLANQDPFLSAAHRAASLADRSTPCPPSRTQRPAKTLAASGVDGGQGRKVQEWDWTEQSPRSKSTAKKQMVLKPIPAHAAPRLQDTACSSSSERPESEEVAFGRSELSVLGRAGMPNTAPEEEEDEPEFEEAILDLPEMSALDRVAKLAEE